MKAKHHIILFILLTTLISGQTYAEELIYKADRAADSKWAFVGGSSCCNCVCDSEGKLPEKFPITYVQAVTFYLLGSRSSSVFNKVISGTTKLKLKLGKFESTALTTELSSIKMIPVRHKWYVTFTFSPPAKVGPGTVWKLLDGDGTWKSAAIAHTSDKLSGGLPGKYITKNCQYAHTENHWYSVKFDHTAAEPVPSEGLKIVEKAPYDISVQLNGKEIYHSNAFSIGTAKSLKDIDGFNIDVLVENAGGNICQTYSCRIIRWKADGQFKISEKFGNCQGPKITQEENKIFLAFESYTMRHSGKTAPAQNWVYEDGVLSQAALPSPYPRPTLGNPKKGALQPQGNNPDCPQGYIWKFDWTVPNPQDVKAYQIRISRPWLKDPVLEEQVKDSKYTWSTCTPIADDNLKSWRWQVRAFYQDETWSEWSDGNDFDVALLDTSAPSIPELVSPKAEAPLLRGYNPQCGAGVQWKFDWKDSTHSSGIKQYEIEIKLLDPEKSTKKSLIKKTVTESEFTFNYCEPIDEKTYPLGDWTVRAQNNAGAWSKHAKPRKFLIGTAPLPPIIRHPEKDEVLPQQNHDSCKEGYEWYFEWEPPDHSMDIKAYHVTIFHKSGTVLFEDRLGGDQNSLVYKSCTPITDYTKGWIFQVQAIAADENMSDWGRRDFIVASYAASTDSWIEGIVKDESGNSLSNVTVSETNSGKSTTTKSDGHYLIENLTPNSTAKVVFRKNGFLRDSIDLTLKTGSNSISLSLAIAASLDCTVKDSEGNNIANVSVTIMGTDKSATTQADGACRISELTPDTTAEIIFQKKDYIQKKVTQKLSAGENSVSVTLDFEPASISGTVTDASGQAVDNAVVTVEGTGKSVSTAADGSFTISDLTPNTQVKVKVSKNGYLDVSEDLALEPGENSLPITLTLLSTVSGTVTDINYWFGDIKYGNTHGGNPLTGVTVSVKDTDISASTDDKGFYTISDLDPDVQYEITFTKESYISMTKSVTLQPGDNSLSVKMIPSAKILEIDGFPETVYGNDHPQLIMDLFYYWYYYFSNPFHDGSLSFPSYTVNGEWKDDSRTTKWYLQVSKAWLVFDYEKNQIRLNLIVHTDNYSDDVSFYIGSPKHDFYELIDTKKMSLFGIWFEDNVHTKKCVIE